MVGRLLESPRFCELTYMIEQYFDNSLSAGYAAQNQMYSTLSAMLRKATKADAAVESARAMNRRALPSPLRFGRRKANVHRTFCALWKPPVFSSSDTQTVMKTVWVSDEEKE